MVSRDTGNSCTGHNGIFLPWPNRDDCGGADALECDQGRVSVPEDVEKCVKSVYVMKI